MTGRFKRMAGAALLAATALGAGSVWAQDPPQDPPKPAAPTTTINVEASTTAKNLSKDILFNNDQRTLINSGKWSLVLENNTGNTFNNGREFASLSYNAKIGAWDVAPGLRFDDEHLREASLYAGRSFGTTRLNTLTVADNRHFGMFRTVVDDITAGPIKIDAGFGYKSFDYAKGIKPSNGGFDFVGGVQAKDGSLGIWAGQAENKDYAVTTIVDKPDVGIAAFGKHWTDGRGFAGAWASFGNDGQRLSETFNPASGLSNPYVPGVGLFFTQDMTDQTVPPLTGSAGSFLANGGKINTEIMVMNMPGARYTQAQVGGKVKSFGNGTALYLGGGQRVATDGSGQHHTTLEGMFNVPPGVMSQNVGVRVEARRAPDFVGSLRFFYQF